MTDALYLAIPAGGSDHHCGVGARAGFHIRQNRIGRSEIDRHIDVAQMLGCEPSCVQVHVGINALHLVATLARHIGNQQPGLAGPQH